MEIGRAGDLNVQKLNVRKLEDWKIRTKAKKEKIKGIQLVERPQVSNVKKKEEDSL